MDIHPVDIIIHILNIVVLYVLLRMILFNPVRKFMNERSERIKAQMQSAEDARAEAEQVKAEYTAMIAKTEDEAKEIIKQGREEAQAQAETIVAEAQTRAETIVAEAGEKAELERRETMKGLKEDIADAAVEIAGRILGREITAKDNSDIVDAFFNEVK